MISPALLASRKRSIIPAPTAEEVKPCAQCPKPAVHEGLCRECTDEAITARMVVNRIKCAHLCVTCGEYFSTTRTAVEKSLETQSSCPACLKSIKAAQYHVQNIKCVDTCTMCNLVFERTREVQLGTFCSEKCLKMFNSSTTGEELEKAQAAARTLQLKKFVNRITCTETCAVCSAPFQRHHHEVERTTCSSTCSKKNRKAEYRNKILAKCLTCPNNRLTSGKYCGECVQKQQNDKVAAFEQHLQNTYFSRPKKEFVERTTDVDWRKVRDHEAKNGMFDFRCPNPSKKVYRTNEEALAFIATVHADDSFIHPYKCRCGAIHIGH